MKVLDEIENELNDIVKIVFSSASGGEYTKQVFRKYVQNDKTYFQAERYKNKQVFHKNYPETELLAVLKTEIKNYADVNVITATKQISYKVNGSKIKRSVNMQQNNAELTHNRTKNYIINEGDKVDILVKLGVFDANYNLIKAQSNKFRQINKFVEIIADKFKNFSGNNLTILDFGCGKSYLTFILHYYFTEVLKLNTKIIGYDLKADVVANCNAYARELGLENITFEVKDVGRDPLYNGHIDMLITLHACDTATDFALNYAIKNGVKYIFSVPCCQHEINLSIKKGGEFDLFLNHGLIKERFCSLLTDTLRIKVLEGVGYKVDALEFVPVEYTPKNLMIRAELKQPKKLNKEPLIEMAKQYKFNQTLLDLV